MLYLKPPSDFSPRFTIVSCFVENNGQILLLHRLNQKPQGNTWGVPAGKVDPGETMIHAMTREVSQETGIQTDPQNFVFNITTYVRYPEYDFIYHIYHLRPADKPAITINSKEHKAFQWITPSGALSLPCIQDLDACIRLCYKIKD